MVPFRRGRFSELPEQPRVPHGYARSQGHELDLHSEPFGRIRVHHRSLGEGPPLLLVHGLMTTSYSWRYVLEPLARHFTVHAPDLVGAGRSDKPLGARYSLPNLATFVAEYQRAVGIVGCPVIGNSLGGAICVELLQRAPASMSRLLVLHAPGFPEPRLWALKLALAIPGVESALAWFIRRDPQRWAHRNVHYWDESLKSLEEAREYGAPLADDAGARTFIRYLKDAVDPLGFMRLQRSIRNRALGAEPPVLLLYARDDPMVPPALGPRWAEALPEARLTWIEEGSHFAHVDAVEPFLTQARLFLGVS